MDIIRGRLGRPGGDVTLVEDLMVKASEYLPKDKMSAIEEAYRFAEAAHEGQVRKSGEPFIEHPLNTALYLAELRLDSTALTAALLMRSAIVSATTWPSSWTASPS